MVLFSFYSKPYVNEPRTISLEPVKTKPKLEIKTQLTDNGPVQFRLYELIEKYADKYDVPRHVAYNIAFMETRYKGPFHKGYSMDVISPSGASGPMQIMPSTAKLVNKRPVSSHELRHDLELNVKTSMKLLRIIRRHNSNWAQTCGEYNTGRPIINSYAIYCSTNKNYRKHWIAPRSI